MRRIGKFMIKICFSCNSCLLLLLLISTRRVVRFNVSLQSEMHQHIQQHPHQLSQCLMYRIPFPVSKSSVLFNHYYSVLKFVYEVCFLSQSCAIEKLLGRREGEGQKDLFSSTKIINSLCILGPINRFHATGLSLVVCH